MKFKQPKTYAPTLSLIGGAIAGAMASRVGYSLLPETKESSTETLYKGAIALATGAGAVFVDGNDIMANIVRGALIGASAEQTLSLVKQIAEDSKVENKLVKQAVGLACPCQEITLANPYANQPGRVIPLKTNPDDFNPYQNSTYSDSPAGSAEWGSEKAKELETLANQTTI